MEFPSGDQSHTHHHHHHRRSDDDERDRPPPFSNEFGVPPPPFRQGSHFPSQPPASYGHEPRFPPQPPAAYHQEPNFPPRPEAPYSDDSYYAPPPPPQNLVSHVHHVPSDPYPPGPRNEDYAPPPPQNLVSHVHHVSSDPYAPGPRNEDYGPPPPQNLVSHVHHVSSDPYSPEPRHDNYAPPPPDPIMASHGDGYPNVSHVSHDSGHESTGHHHHSFQPHLPSFLPHRRHEENHLPPNLAGFVNRPTVKVYSKAEPNYYLTIRDGKLILARSDPSDESQHWYKDEKFSTRVKDSEGCPCFSLVNKATGLAMKHSLGATQPVELIPYDPDGFDEAVLWTESKDLGDGYRTVRMVNNVHLNMDAYHGDKKSGGVRDGTLIVLWDWNKGDNQRWKIVPF